MTNRTPETMAWSAKLETLEIRFESGSDEIDDVSILEPIDDVADRAAHDETDGDGDKARLRRDIAEIPEHAGDDEQGDDEEYIARHRQHAKGSAGVAAARQLESGWSAGRGAMLS